MWSINLYAIVLCLFTTQFALQEGDLLFQDSDCGPFCDAIEKVTEGYKGSNFSHVGMVIKEENGKLAVIEAITAGVVITPLDTFFNRSFDTTGNPKIAVGRLSPEYQNLVRDALLHAKSLLGRPYDDVFDINNEKYYCSELVYEAFKSANNGNEIFHLFPMTFVDPDINKTFGIWEEYYKNLGETIPEGQPGLNPGGMSRSERIEIVHMYGNPSGYGSK